ncbi:MAG TPA: sulfur carrier protein ThiS [Micromonosporaceae bacterium]|jgi:sulfur carrier protein|nr:sulfur carrier protein ThiS [Micromonosporaceae bacterium]
MKVDLNGASRTLAEDATVADAVASLTTAVTGVAVAVNGEVVPRGVWSATALRDGDRLEVLTAAQGG